MLPEIISLIWLIIGLTIGTSVTGIFAVKEMNKLRLVNDLLQSKLNHQIKTNKTLRLYSVSSSFREIEKQDKDEYIAALEQGIDELSAHIERYDESALAAIHRLSGGNVKAFLRDVYDDSPEVSLTKIRANQSTKSFIAGAESVVEQFHRMIGVPISLLENNAPPVIRQRANKHAEEILNSKDGE